MCKLFREFILLYFILQYQWHLHRHVHQILRLSLVPTYQGEEEIPEEVIPLLRQYGFYWIMKMGSLKINVGIN